MNRIFYIAGQLIAGTKRGIIAGHGYSYNIDNPGRKMVKKDVPTPYGYFVGYDHQSTSVNIEDYYSLRIVDEEVEKGFLRAVELILRQHAGDTPGSKVLIATSMPKLTKAFVSGNGFKNVDENYVKTVRELYLAGKDNVIFDLNLYPKGGLGIRQATNQLRTAEMLIPFKPLGEKDIKQISEKEFNNPDVDLNPLVTASRWYFNTGDTSKFYDLVGDGWRRYDFGKVDPDKKYYGKATPDVCYSILYTKTPLSLLDKLYDFTQEGIDNELNLLFAGILNNIKSKEVARTLNDTPGSFKDGKLISPMQIATNDEPALVEHLNPPGLAYRIENALEHLNDTYTAFLKKDDVVAHNKRTRFMDITSHFFETDEKGKLKLKSDFTSNTLKMIIPIESDRCVKPVKINLSVSYDCPDRNSFNSLLKSKIEDIKVWLVLNFNDDAGVSYCTITQTPEFNYIHTNSVANLRVYSLKELGGQ